MPEPAAGGPVPDHKTILIHTRLTSGSPASADIEVSWRAQDVLESFSGTANAEGKLELEIGDEDVIPIEIRVAPSELWGAHVERRSISRRTTDIEILLDGPPILTIRVQDVSGLISGALVELKSKKGQLLTQGRTADGEIYVPWVFPERPVIVTATYPGLVSLGQIVVEQPLTTDSVFVLTLARPARLRVTVRGPTGSLVQGCDVGVRVESLMSSGSQTVDGAAWSSKTSADGSCVLSGIPSQSSVVVTADATEGRGLRRVFMHEDREGQVATVVNLKEGQESAFLVQDASGNPISQCTVGVDGQALGSTDEKGMLVCSIEANDHSEVWAFHPAYSFAWKPIGEGDWWQVKQIALSAGEAAGGFVVDRQGNGVRSTLVIPVLKEAGESLGAGIERGRRYLEHAKIANRGRTARDGSFRLPPIAGSDLLLVIHPPGSAPFEVVVPVAPGIEIVVPDETEFQSDGVFLGIEVIDRVAGTPLPGASVAVFRDLGTARSNVEVTRLANRSGKVSIAFPTGGEFSIYVELKGYMQTSGHEFSLEPGPHSIQVSMDLTQSLSLQVLEHDGKPVGNAMIVGRDERGDLVEFRWTSGRTQNTGTGVATGADGRVTIDSVPIGRHALTVYRLSNEAQPQACKTIDVDVVPGSKEDLVIRLPKE